MNDRPKQTAADRLPGDLTRAQLVARMIRVDHAGEYGAKRIYDGQLAVLGEGPARRAVQRMADQEQDHLDGFSALVVARRVRPTALTPIWNVAGFVLGAASALAGERAAMACTVAVESVIEQHYAGQAKQLGDDEAGLRDTIERFRDDEIAHRDTGFAHDAEKTVAYVPLTLAVKAGTRLAIWLSERV